MFESKDFKQTNNNGVVTLSYEDKDAYLKGNEEVTTDMIKAVGKYSKDYVEQVTTFAAEEGQKIMAKDKSVTQVVVEAPFNHSYSKVEAFVKREKEVSAPGSTEKKIRSDVKVKVTDYNCKVSDKQIREMNQALTAALL
jgi:hypothetical protein